MAPSPHLVVVHQPDGREIRLRFRGSPAYAWYEDARGYPVVKRRDTYLYAVVDEHGELLPTTLAVGGADPRRAGLRRGGPSAEALRRHAERARAARGGGSALPGRSLAASASNLENLVILVRFANHGPSGQNRTLPSITDVETIFNEPGGDPVLAPSGSLRDYYEEISYGTLEVSSTAAGWFDLSGDESYYADGSSGLSSTLHGAIVEGLEAADPLVDFSLFDEDENLQIDAITFLHSGYGAEWGGVDAYGTDWADRIWSHKWSIPTWTSDEGVSVSEYHISPALWDVSGDEPGRIGVIAHELAHFLGLPDTYDTDGSSIGNGDWCLMASGAWAVDGMQLHPTHPSAWAKWKMGWLTDTPILPGTYVAPAVETNPVLFRIQSGYPPGECLLVENRQPVGFNALLPQGGISLWHIDDAMGSISGNDVNDAEGHPGMPGWPTNGWHHRIALLQPDDLWDLELYTNLGDAGDLFHDAGVTQILPTSSPNLDAYQGGVVVSNGNRLTDIGAVTGGMEFTYDDVFAPVITVSPLVFTVGVSSATTLEVGGAAGAVIWNEVRGAPDYVASSAGTSGFRAVGIPQGWNADDATWALELPFAFPFFDSAHGTVYVSSNGFVDLVPGAPEPFNLPSHLRLTRRIAPLWDDLTTAGPGEDVFVDRRPGEVEIRWQASVVNGGAPCNVSVVLAEDGTITFHYGPGNSGLTPTVGLSRGHSGSVVPATGLDGRRQLASASSHTFRLVGSALPPGLGLRGDGTLSGTPTKAGTHRVRVRATDSRHHYDERDLLVRVLPRGHVGAPADSPLPVELRAGPF